MALVVLGGSVPNPHLAKRKALPHYIGEAAKIRGKFRAFNEALQMQIELHPRFNLAEYAAKEGWENELNFAYLLTSGEVMQGFFSLQGKGAKVRRVQCWGNFSATASHVWLMTSSLCVAQKSWTITREGATYIKRRIQNFMVRTKSTVKTSFLFWYGTWYPM